MGHTTCRGPCEDQTKSPGSHMRTRLKNLCAPLIISVIEAEQTEEQKLLSVFFQSDTRETQSTAAN